MARFHVLLFDDVHTKVSLEAVAGLEPSYAIETSPGNFQYGYVLEAPLENLDEIAALQDAVADAELCDKGAKGATRWARLPYAINGKEKHRVEGRPYQCKLSQCSGRRFSLSELYDGFKLGMKPPASTVTWTRRHISRARPTNISHEVFRAKLDENPVITALKARSLYKGELKAGVHEKSSVLGLNNIQTTSRQGQRISNRPKRIRWADLNVSTHTVMISALAISCRIWKSSPKKPATDR